MSTHKGQGFSAIAAVSLARGRAFLASTFGGERCLIMGPSSPYRFWT